MQVYTDGSCIQNPGPGGWAFLVVSESSVVEERSGGEYRTTNNRMELQAVIEALLYVSSDYLTIYTDSQLVMNCASNIWKRKANLDLWSEFDNAARGKQIEWQWVKGHNGNRFNERVDYLARQKAIKYQSLYK